MCKESVNAAVFGAVYENEPLLSLLGGIYSIRDTLGDVLIHPVSVKCPSCSMCRKMTFRRLKKLKEPLGVFFFLSLDFKGYATFAEMIV